MVVAPGGSIVTVVDDYAKTAFGTPVSGNVLTNDQGTGLTVSNAGAINSPGKGTLTLASNGSYTFVPSTGVTGPVDFTYTACDNSTTAVCGTATLHILVAPLIPVLNPDFAVTTKNVPVSGNVNTNDVVPAGTTYGTPVAAGSNPAGGIITSNPDGTFSFTATSAGSYTYTVPVCPVGQSVSCPSTPLIITVLDPTVTNNPVANPDYASTNVGVPVTVNVKANDGLGNVSIGGALGTPTIVTNPVHGSTSINGSGNLVYTPTAGYIGDDVMTYQVCETPSGLCATAQVTVHVTPTGSSTVAIVDDYVKTPLNLSVNGSVLTNDQGTGLTVSNAGTITSPGKGTLVLSSTGSFTFTPVTGVSGPVDFTYTACDNSATAICGTATLHILVMPQTTDLSPIIFARPQVANGTKNVTVVVDVVELKGVTSAGLIRVRVTKDALISLNFSSADVSVGNRPVQNSVWTFSEDEDNYFLTTTEPVQANNLLSFGLKGVLTPGASAGTLTISATIVGNSGGEVRVTNNVDADKIDYFQN